MNMIYNKILTIAPLLALLTACSHKDENLKPDENITTHVRQEYTQDGEPTHPLIGQNVPTNNNTSIKSIPQQNHTLSTGSATIDSIPQSSNGLSGEFAGNWKLENFIQRMHTEQNFELSYLYKLFSNAQNSDFVNCTTSSSSSCATSVPQGKWDRYKGMFVYERNIKRGVAFWQEHEQALNRAYQKYGVLPEFIVGILGVETAYGVNFGKKRVIDVLTTKAMLGGRREDFYTRQLEKFLILTQQSHLDARTLMGSNAGAMGYGQFIASSYMEFAVDFNGDGSIDLWNAEDAIGSIANYFSRNGWNRNISQVAVRAKYRGNRFKRLKTGYKTKYSQYKLRRKHGITPRTKLHYRGPVSLIKLPRASYDELWFGTHNFRVITTYNHSTFYGMAVFKLGQAVKHRRYGR